MINITIPESEYNELVRDQKKLWALEGGGVDNWEGYNDSLEEFWTSEETG